MSSHFPLNPTVFQKVGKFLHSIKVRCARYLTIEFCAGSVTTIVKVLSAWCAYNKYFAQNYSFHIWAEGTLMPTLFAECYNNLACYRQEYGSRFVLLNKGSKVFILKLIQ